MDDVFGRMVADHRRDELAGQPVYERSDGDRSPAQCAWYFTGPEEWGPLERSALDAVAGGEAGGHTTAGAGDGATTDPTARAPVLDAGCGPGRALGPLADRGHPVLGIDESPGAVRVAREWTGQPAVVGDLAALPVGAGSIHGALFLGTHVGTGGTVGAFRSLLDELDRAIVDADRAASDPDEGSGDVAGARTGGRVVADLYDPTAVEDPDLSAYLEGRWVEEGVATRRFRLRYDGEAGRWRTLLMCSPAALRRLVAPTAWSVAAVERGAGTRYLFVLERG